MDNPLGSAVGNALEVRESVRFLRGEGAPGDLPTLARRVAVRLLELKEIPDAEAAVEETLSSGSACEKFREFVRAQGGDADALEDLPVSGEVREVTAPRDGYVARFEALGIGRAALTLGAGRERKGDAIDPGAGVEVLAKVGDRLEAGDPVARLYGGRNVERAEASVREALKLSDEPVERGPAILEAVSHQQERGS
jgi:thymidine phosphorylase